MATAEAIAELRLLVGIPTDAEPYTDEKLSDRLDAVDGEIETVADKILLERISASVSLVDISEAGSSRRNSQVVENLIKARSALGTGSGGGELPGSGPTIRRIVRP